METQQKIRIEFYTTEEMLLVFGELDENIRKIEKVTGAMIRQTQEGVEITGDAESTAMASDTINNLLKLIRNGELVDENTVSYILDAGTEGNQEEAVSALADVRVMLRGSIFNVPFVVKSPTVVGFTIIL